MSLPNRIRSLEFDQVIERDARDLYSPRFRRAETTSTLKLELDLNESTAEKLIAAFAGLAAGKPRHQPIDIRDLKLPQVLAILVSELKE